MADTYVELPASDSTLAPGAATAANQTVEIAYLASIDGKLTPPLAVIGPLTDTQLRASPVPVSLTSTTITGTVAVTQGTTPWDDNITQFGGNAVVTGVGVSGLGIPRVTVSNDSNILTTQSGAWNINNVSGTISLPTGASTAANQATEIASLASIDAGIPAALGQATMAASMPVVIASNQTSIPISNFPTTADTNFGTVGASTLRTAAQVGNATGAANFGAGATSAQTLRVVSNLNDGSANSITSQANGSQRALDVGINVAGVQIDPRAASPGTLTDRSGTATTTSATLAAANANRKYIFIQNVSTGDIWINFTTAATNASPSIRIDASGVFVMEGSFISTEAINIRSNTSTRPFVAKEG